MRGKDLDAAGEKDRSVLFTRGKVTVAGHAIERQLGKLTLEHGCITYMAVSYTHLDVYKRQVLESFDARVYIPMSSALSGSCATASALADDYDGRVYVVDNQRISATQRASVLDAVDMARAGLDAATITEVLTREKLEASIYITVDTLKYLKKGGRITPAAASLGTVLGIKPVLQIQGEKLDALSMAHGLKSANAICWMLWNAI